jgi:hypothetical protein
VTLTPSPRAIAGDYRSDPRQRRRAFRSAHSITVLTSSLGGAVDRDHRDRPPVVVFAVARFGRRENAPWRAKS